MAPATAKKARKKPAAKKRVSRKKATKKAAKKVTKKRGRSGATVAVTTKHDQSSQRRRPARRAPARIELRDMINAGKAVERLQNMLLDDAEPFNPALAKELRELIRFRLPSLKSVELTVTDPVEIVHSWGELRKK